MKNDKIRISIATALLIGCMIVGPVVRAQAPVPLAGTITAISGNTLTVKTDAGELRQVEVPAAASMKRIAPGQRI